MPIEEIKYRIPLPFGRGLGIRVLREVPPISPKSRPDSQVVLRMVKDPSGEVYGLMAEVEDENTVTLNRFGGDFCSPIDTYSRESIKGERFFRGKLRWRP